MWMSKLGRIGPLRPVALSFGNSGAVSPGSVAPVAMPGVLASLPSMLVDPDSPLYLPLGYLPRAVAVA